MIEMRLYKIDFAGSGKSGGSIGAFVVAEDEKAAVVAGIAKMKEWGYRYDSHASKIELLACEDKYLNGIPLIIQKSNTSEEE